jgi:hypothetical protein
VVRAGVQIKVQPGVAATLIMGIIVGIQTAKVANELNSPGGTGTSSNCLSQGGTDPNC